MFQHLDQDEAADQHYHRAQLADPASLVPDAWMEETCALGPLSRCVDVLQSFRDAGADEIVFYGSPPAQNIALVEAWRHRTART